MDDILAKVEAEIQYVVQIPAEFQKAYESDEYFIVKNTEAGKTAYTAEQNHLDRRN